MNAIDLITYDIPPLVHTDTGEKAMNWMDEFKVSHLPVLKNGNYVGLVSETDILDKLDFSENLDVLFQHLPRPYVKADTHLFEILAKISEFKISVMPILDAQEKYLGCTNIFELMTTIANTSSIKEKGGILVLEVSQSDYSMAQIGQIVESNNAKILSSTILSDASSTNLDI
ncbi:MAG: CBS domain-containing protein, partial [Crocinitomicaceae bacterium]